MFNKITLGPITIYMYGLMIAIGFASALFLCNYRGKKRGLSEDTIFGIFLCALIGGMVGCRLLYYIVELPAIMEDPSIAAMEERRMRGMALPLRILILHQTV